MILCKSGWGDGERVPQKGYSTHVSQGVPLHASSRSCSPPEPPGTIRDAAGAQLVTEILSNSMSVGRGVTSGGGRKLK